MVIAECQKLNTNSTLFNVKCFGHLWNVSATGSYGMPDLHAKCEIPNAYCQMPLGHAKCYWQKATFKMLNAK